MGFTSVFKWVDDTTIWQIPTSSTTGEDGTVSYTYHHPNLEPVFKIAGHLGIPLHPEKVQNFGTLITYVGFDWDIANKTVSLPEKKRLKYLGKLQSFLATYSPHGVKLYLKPLESLHGSLMHCTFVIRAGRSYLKATQRFMHTFNGSHGSARYLAASVVREVASGTIEVPVVPVPRTPPPGRLPQTLRRCIVELGHRAGLHRT